MKTTSRARWGFPLILATVALGSPAAAVSVQCASDNAENIALGLADAAGYSQGAGISPAGMLSIDNQTLTLPPNGILCVKSITCATSSRSLTFAKNAANSPVYLLVEDDVNLAQPSCGIDVSGAGPTSVVGLGLDRLGGLGGPGGSDGGSCDATFSSPPRAGAGHGPGGGGGVPTAAGGGGASPISEGTGGFSGAAGGTPYSQWTDRMLHGGSGGGCGGNGSNTFFGGAGGGGVLVLAAGGAIQLTNAGSYIHARGGPSTAWGGGGGGGVIRLVADSISGNGALRVDGSNGAACGNSSTRGGCGGAGLVKLEGDAAGALLGNVSPGTSLHLGVPQELVPPTLARPTLEIASVDATWGGVPGSQTPGPADPNQHVHRSPSVFLEAPDSPLQTITVRLQSNNVAHTAAVRVRMNTLGAAPSEVTASTLGTGSGLLEWTAQLLVPAGMQLGAVEAWIVDTCTPGAPGCDE